MINLIITFSKIKGVVDESEAGIEDLRSFKFYQKILTTCKVVRILLKNWKEILKKLKKWLNVRFVSLSNLIV